jgi:hypothetical protein
MNDALATVQIESSGVPDYLTLPKETAVIWPTASTLLSSILTSFANITTTPRSETVFLTRAHQRIMDRALRRSVKIIG